jgi:hypothetical protein
MCPRFVGPVPFRGSIANWQYDAHQVPRQMGAFCTPPRRSSTRPHRTKTTSTTSQYSEGPRGDELLEACLSVS